MVEPDRTGMEVIAALVEDGALHVHVARTFPLSQAALAMSWARAVAPTAASSSSRSTEYGTGSPWSERV